MIQDRAKDLVKSGGEWISTVALESALVEHAGVSEAVVVAVPHPRWGERPLAVIVPAPGCAPTIEEIRAHLAPRVAKWWLPDAVVHVDASAAHGRRQVPEARGAGGVQGPLRRRGAGTSRGGGVSCVAVDPHKAVRSAAASGCGHRSAEGGQHVIDRGELQARPAARLTVREFQRVEAPPVGVGDEERLACLHQRRAASASGCAGVKCAPCATSSSIAATVSTESGLLVPMTPLGPRLIQPDAYSPVTTRPRVGIEHAPLLVQDHAPALVERHAGQRDAPVPHRAKHQADIEILVLAGGPRIEAARRPTPRACCARGASE